MRRREFMTTLGALAGTWPFAGRAQQPSMPVVGFLNGGSPVTAANRARAFREGLNESGYVEGQNVTIEYRWAEDQYDRLPALAADLVRRNVSLIAAGNNIPTVNAARAAAPTLPIVFMIGADPVEAGFVASLNRPGGNLTGATSLAGELLPKRLELIREIVPKASAVAILVNPTNPNFAEVLLRDVRAAARALGLDIHILHASNAQDIDAAFATLDALPVEALVIAAEPLFTGKVEQLGELALRHAKPAIYQSREFTTAGGLMSYGSSPTESSRQAGVYAGRILKGEKPADLPVVRSAKIELIINLKTAKALGLTVPLSLLGRADEVIE
jgi:putative ABC transport system substrate-binding protein